MKLRHVYTTSGVDHALACVRIARARLGDDGVGLVARSDIALERIPDGAKLASPTDFLPSALRGFARGGSIGLLAGLVAASIPTLGITLAGTALLGFAGAAVGTWSGALVGAALPDDVQRQFADRIQAGEVLLVIDVDDERAIEIDGAMLSCAAQRLDYEAPAAVS